MDNDKILKFKTFWELFDWFDKNYQDTPDKEVEFQISLENGNVILMRLSYIEGGKKHKTLQN